MGQHKMRAEDAKEVMRVAYAEGLKDGAAKARTEERAAVVVMLRQAMACMTESCTHDIEEREQRAVDKARASERAAVVAMLRQAGRIALEEIKEPEARALVSYAYEKAADEIAAGTHLPKSEASDG